MKTSNKEESSISIKELESIKRDLEDTLAYLRDLTFFLPIGFCSVSAVGVITDVNQSLLELSGYKEGELIGLNVKDVFGEKKYLEELMEKCVRENFIRDGELILLNKQKNKIPVSVALSARKSEEGILFGYFFAVSDITERKRFQNMLEKKVKERTKELQIRIEELEKYHMLTVGRELKMIELKKEAEALKEELNKYKNQSGTAI